MNVACEGGKASYTVDYNGKQMLGTSALGLVANYGDFSKDLTMGILKWGSEAACYKMTRIKKSDIQKDVVDATIGFLNSKKDSMTLHLHVSNNDIAYKYEMSRPKKDNPKSVIIYNEVSGFNFPEKTTTFLCPQITPMTGWERTKPSYEEEYTPDAPMNVKSQFGVGYTFPCLFKVGSDGWVLVSETGVSSAYPAAVFLITSRARAIPSPSLRRGRTMASVPNMPVSHCREKLPGVPSLWVLRWLLS